MWSSRTQVPVGRWLASEWCFSLFGALLLAFLGRISNHHNGPGLRSFLLSMWALTKSVLSIYARILVSCPESSNVTTQDVINHLISDQFYRGLVHRVSGMHLRFLFPPNFGIFFNSRLVTFSKLLLGANESTSTCKCKRSEYSCTSLKRRHIIWIDVPRSTS